MIDEFAHDAAQQQYGAVDIETTSVDSGWVEQSDFDEIIHIRPFHGLSAPPSSRTKIPLQLVVRYAGRDYHPVSSVTWGCVYIGEQRNVYTTEGYKTAKISSLSKDTCVNGSLDSNIRLQYGSNSRVTPVPSVSCSAPW